MVGKIRHREPKCGAFIKEKEEKNKLISIKKKYVKQFTMNERLIMAN
jgi:hypothetical protein